MDLPQELDKTGHYYKTQILSAEQLLQVEQSTEELSQSGLVERSLQVGDRAPSFALTDIQGNLVESQKLLEAGPIVLSFYRGMWCPFCSLELRALEEICPTIQSLGAVLISLSPQTRQFTRLTVEQRNLTHLVLSDANNQVARQFGIVYQVTESMYHILEESGIPLDKFNGDNMKELPVPATFIISQSGTIAYRLVDPDFTRRLDPVEIVTVLSRLNKVATT